MEYDVIVAGGGIAGSCAAIAAARLGVKTLLVERQGYLGGMLTCANVGPMMTFHAKQGQIIRGIPQEIVERLQAQGDCVGHIPDGIGFTETITPFNAEGMKRVLEDMATEAGCALLYHTQVTDAEVDRGRLERVAVSACGRSLDLRGKVWIDATGDGELSALAGARYEYGNGHGKTQALTLVMKMNGVDTAQVRSFAAGHPEQFPSMRKGTAGMDGDLRLAVGGFAGFFKDADLPYPFGEVLFFETATPGEVIVNTTRIYEDPLDPWALTRAEIEGRKMCAALAQFMCGTLPGFAHAAVTQTGPVIGVRSSRRVVCDKTVTREDLLSARTWPDTIAHSAYPIDVHDPDTMGNRAVLNEEGLVYSVPLGCLVVRGLENLLVAGRCLSADFEAQAALRVTPAAGAIGQGAGTAAALAVQSGQTVRQVNVRRVQGSLIAQHAYLKI